MRPKRDGMVLLRFVPGERLVDRLHERSRLRLGVAYAAANSALPVRLHVSYSANVSGNVTLVQQMQTRHYAGLSMAFQLYGGGHIGMIPAAFTDALTFALA